MTLVRSIQVKCIVAGCTQSGKTVWVKSLLENAQTTIRPTPQRIIWCYGQWQPSYFDMMRMMPGIEFNEGIPEDIDNADFLDVSQRNLIVLDELIAQSGKDNSKYWQRKVEYEHEMPPGIAIK